MPSHLRHQSSEEPIAVHATYQSFPPLESITKPRMSLTQTYYVASTARTKLGREASRADHNLRRLVGHANLLDTLMVELADAEREQEAWFNQAVHKAAKPEEPRRVQWIDTIAEVAEDVDDDDDVSDTDSEVDSESDSEPYDEEMYDAGAPLRRIRSPPAQLASTHELLDDLDDDADYYSDEDIAEDDESDGALTLTRTVSNKHSPPELTLDSSDSEESEDEAMPPSPERPTFALTDAQRKAIATTSFYDTQDLDLLPAAAASPPALIAAY